MRKTVVRDGETAQALAQRVHRPLCMLLRANRVFSGAWFLPGREIEVPSGDFCGTSDFPCPSRVARLPAVEKRLYLARAGETREEIARACGVPARMIPAGQRALCLPVCPDGWRIRTVKPGESVSDPYIRAVNGLSDKVLPGTRILSPGK